MLKRKFEDKLNLWLNSNKVMLVDGARQVGKTYLIENFLRSHFKNYIYINLALNLDAISAFEHAKNVKDFLLVISAFSDKPLVDSETAIFIDEIQMTKEIDFFTIAKGLATETKYRFIFSGSLLGVTEFNIALEPTGYMYEETMYPLDFEEFLWANNVQEDVLDVVKDSFNNRKKVPDFIHEKFMSLFYKYLMVGGLPEAVDTYIKTNDLYSTHLVHKRVETYYKKDVTQYSIEANRPYILNAYDLVPSELSSKNKRFILSKVDDDYSISKCENDFIWLKDAGIAIPVYNANEPKIPLLLSKNTRLLKLFLNDVGLLCYRLLDTGIQNKILAKEKDINFGSIFENAVAQELNSHGFTYNKLFYFSSKKQGEVDFLITYNGNILPIEVKSGKDYKRHVALDNLLRNKEYDIKEGFIFGDFNFSADNKKIYYPIYMIGLLSNILQ